MLLRGPNSVLLRENHWKVHVKHIQQDAISISGVQSPASGSDVTLAPAPPARSHKAKLHYEAPFAGEGMQRDTEICKILTDMIGKSKTGWVDPSHTRNWQLLQRYVPPGGLKTFIREHQQFEVFQLTPNTWTFGFAPSRGSGRNEVGGSTAKTKDDGKLGKKPTPDAITCAICTNVRETYVETENKHYLCFGCWDSGVANGKLSAHDRILAWNTMRDHGELVDKTGIISFTYPFPSHVQ